MVLTFIIPLRAVFKLKHLIRMYHLQAMAKLLLFTSLIVGYAYSIEVFIAWYSGNTFEQAIFLYRATGDYDYIYWSMVTCNVLIPMVFFFKKARNNIAVLFIVSIFVNFGMWFERFNIIVSSLAHEFMPYGWGLYSMSLTEWGILVGSFGWFFLLLLAFFKVLPSVSIGEVKETMPQPKKGDSP